MVKLGSSTADIAAMDKAVLDAIRKADAVPSMPQVLARFLEAIEDPSFKYDDIVKILSADPGVVADVLRLANSALFGLTRKVTNLRQALTLLGPKRTRSLVLGRCLVAGFENKLGGLIDKEYFWRRSLASAVIAARIAEHVAPQHRDEAFIGGLLADIGIPILAAAVPEKYQPFALRHAPYGGAFGEEDEQSAVGATHGEVAEQVLIGWGLPAPICRAVAMHQRDGLVPADDVARSALILNAADRIARLLCEVPDVGLAGQTCADAASLVGMDLTALGRILGEIGRDVEELAAVLHVQVIPSHVYGLIAQSVQEMLAGSAA